MNEYSFQKGWSQIRQIDVATVRNKIMAALKISTRAGFLYRLHGNCEPKASEFVAIEKIFNEYGIKDIWGKVE